MFGDNIEKWYMDFMFDDVIDLVDLPRCGNDIVGVGLLVLGLCVTKKYLVENCQYVFMLLLEDLRKEIY